MLVSWIWLVAVGMERNRYIKRYLLYKIYRFDNWLEFRSKREEGVKDDSGASDCILVKVEIFQDIGNSGGGE